MREAMERAWEAWLATYFDGGAHALDGVERVFPLVTRGYGQSAAPQPLSGDQTEPRAHLQVRCEAGVGVARRDADTAGADAGSAVLEWKFLVLAGGPSAGDGNAAWLARRVGDMLFGLLQSPEARMALARAGMVEIAPRAPQPLVTREWGAMTVLGARVRGQWEIKQG